MLRQGLCSIVVCAAFAASAAAVPIQISKTSGVTGWNSPGSVISDIGDLLDANGDPTGISLTTDDTNSFNLGNNASGTASPGAPASTYFPGTVTGNSYFGHTGSFQSSTYPTAVWTFDGLDPSKSYDFIFFAIRNSVSDNRETEYELVGANTVATYLDAANNTSNIAQALGVTPTAGGQVVLSVTAGPNNTNSAGFYYLTAMRFEESVPEPASMLLLASGVLVMLRRRR